ncbi:carbohydrate ABC transporter membrane protein 2 (CUT1 family) [Asanoa ferruginea]|uniref:Carbohydrate ABC transporter membrane protein 2 (CUT1 family) n=1 Tax=Asanoa ferruginea TaxID=53367 RepID=A0A3D9ZJS8_9ACTN|nr:carbohydrate ABC transporter permease [Asanoa ferruginea]REF97477.1 carbohydrate ABC transporter membrane protein 2 (CUT1 family) [Asanoa ferruginea]GIF48239.1 sugar ABC transporter permease [Asanoa ferruginea]
MTESIVRRGKAQRRWHLHLILAIAAAIMVVPFVWQILTVFKSTAEVTRIPPTILPHGYSLHSFETFFATVPFWSMFAVSVGALVLRVGGQVIVAALAGYAFARIPFRGRGVLLGVFLAMLMVPSQLFLIGQYGLIRDLKLLDTLPALAIPGLFSAFGTFLMRQAFRTMPNDYEEAARLDGANPLQVFWHIMLPMARPTVAALAVLTGLYSWNDLLWPLIVSPSGENRPLSVGLAGLQGQFGTDYPTLMAGAFVCSIPLVAVFLFLQRQFFAGIAGSGIKG